MRFYGGTNNSPSSSIDRLMSQSWSMRAPLTDKKFSRSIHSITMKKLSLFIVAMFVAIAAHAQFQAGKGYVGASLTGLSLNYNGKNGFNIGAEAKAGILFEDNWMVLAHAAIKHNGSNLLPDDIEAGAGIRYYIIQNGLYLGAQAKFIHADHSYNDVMPGVEIGYAFFINRSVTIEPAIYYDHSFNNSDYSNVGAKIGIGIYLFDD